ncbi:HD domain-containing protein [Niallia sp.]|uniref:HD domain-containing protein n=1 Tax=Niallia sp. TaxID=2837523 RepID=UPI0028A0F820|nr:HD domain-containing protein [Niallia sp.]
MLIWDNLYGEFEVEKVLEELIKSKPIQRLKGIHQGGASYLVNTDWNITRYEHSIGVMLLIRKFGGSIEEQIAGLLHDVSHTAFSHVVDFVLDKQHENYHEAIFLSVIKDSEIPTILEKYNYDYEKFIVDDSKWSILEQPAPELCADRVDYTLRDMYTYGKITLKEVHEFLENVLIVDAKMCLKNVDSAEWFVETYYKEVIGFFMHPLNIYGYDRLTNILALAKNIITFTDLLGEDEELMNRISVSMDMEIQQLLGKLHPSVEVIEDVENYDIYLKNKVRLIDPSIFYQNKLMRASSLSKKVQGMNRVAYDKAKKGTYIKVIKAGENLI